MGKKVETPTATYAKLKDGTWGVRGKGLKKGCPVEVKKKSGEVKDEIVKWIFFTNEEGVSLASIEKEPRDYKADEPGARRGYKPCYFCKSWYCEGSFGGLCDDD